MRKQQSTRIRATILCLLPSLGAALVLSIGTAGFSQDTPIPASAASSSSEDTADSASSEAEDVPASAGAALDSREPASPSTDAGTLREGEANQGAEDDRVAVPQPSEKALRYYRSGNLLWLINTAWGLLLPAIFLFAGWSGNFRRVAKRMGRNWFFTIVIYLVFLELLFFLVNLPLEFYGGYVRQHAYGLSNQSLGKWFQDRLLEFIVGVIGGALVLWVPYLLLAKSPKRWWLYTSILAVPFLLLVMLIQPIFVAPLFNDFGEMQDKELEAKILALAERCGIEDSRVFEVNKSVDTKAVNAYVTGVGSTKRIVLWDTMLQKLDSEEVLFVMGHEMGHYVLNHIPRTIMYLSVLILATLYAVHRSAGSLLSRFKKRFGFEEIQDIASLPLLILLFNLYSLIVMPIVMGISRHHELEADRFGLEITHDNHAAASAFAKLQQENLGNPYPGPLYIFWRSTHPPLGSRIEFCNEYRPWESGEPQAYQHLFRQ